ncbi:2-amino-4-hydroxy-6-hydroxymethyldihydropteridine diphosphokinase [Guyparkeria hydrothermalis]|uniref:2-amino-4-hydroxy-6- hydroxymethyldihydropteridine diphosphokinase n=1 Tax=Guyparkeria hydrothermalis TaxID=923 RepID=UPI002021BBFB|nr:2-amino-4-hydroxy-6-hydroxymethyldihydropteridine diphosphokinase [Guyparkeria hydrothermalis]MCL7744187.1 2-amino-4-hydroxy-6-hydroxymethyldihydropteridine diphosphokinase [Guyparkeria hydrothermalis]
MVREIATIGLGANLGDPVDQIERAVEAIDSLPLCRVRAVSGLYSNPPIGPQDQPDYVNAVAEIETALAPAALLRALKGLERAAGRSYTRHWGERMLDLDILAFGDREMTTAELTIPHPEIAHRHFVLAPWLEIRPEACLPDGSRLASWLEAVSDHPLRFLRPLRWQRHADQASSTGRADGPRPSPTDHHPSDSRRSS